MIYSYKYQVTKEAMLKLNRRAQNAMQRAARVKKELTVPSRELQMVPMYLELAKLNENYRFTASEIAEITDLVKTYGSEIPATDLIKQLLNIGVEKGEPLSTQELKNFLQTTAVMDKEEQNKVITFIKTFKEQDLIKEDTDRSSERQTFEQFKSEVAAGNDSFLKEMPEKRLWEFYFNRIRRELNYINYKSYTSQLDVLSPRDISRFINLSNLGFVYSVARCEKPEIIAEIVQKIGLVPELAMIPNDLIQAYELSKGNKGLIEDLTIGFYPSEAKQIVSKLVARKDTQDLSEYCPEINASSYRNPCGFNYDLAEQRRKILATLGLTGQIDLLPLQTCKRINIVSGSFEQGKRQ